MGQLSTERPLLIYDIIFIIYMYAKYVYNYKILGLQVWFVKYGVAEFSFFACISLLLMCSTFNYFLASLGIHTFNGAPTIYFSHPLMSIGATKPVFSLHGLIGWWIHFGEQKYHRFRGCWCKCKFIQLFPVWVATSVFPSWFYLPKLLVRFGN